METVYFKQVQQFKADHANCMVDYDLSTDDRNTVVVRCDKHHESIKAHIPYRMFCLNLKECAGRTSCPRNYSCCE